MAGSTPDINGAYMGKYKSEGSIVVVETGPATAQGLLGLIDWRLLKYKDSCLYGLEDQDDHQLHRVHFTSALFSHRPSN